MAEIIDLDSIIRADREAAVDSAKYVKMKVFGNEYRITTSPNIYTSLAAGTGDPVAIANLITNVLHEDDRDSFTKELMNAAGISAEVLLKMLNAMLEAVAERPTKSSSGSSTGRKASPGRKPKSALD
jgi:hypothetical protein